MPCALPMQGSAEALCSSLEELEVADDKLRVRTRVLRAGAGAISSEDVMLASVSSAVVLGFNSAAARPTKEEATRANVVRRRPRAPASPRPSAPVRRPRRPLPVHGR